MWQQVGPGVALQSRVQVETCMVCVRCTNVCNAICCVGCVRKKGSRAQERLASDGHVCSPHVTAVQWQYLSFALQSR